MVVLIAKFTRMKSKVATYNIKKFEVTIECEGSDIKQIQRHKYLTKRVRKEMANQLGVNLDQLEILTVKNDKKGILLIFMYNTFDLDRDSANGNNPFMQRLVTETDNMQSIIVSLSLLVENDALCSFREQIKDIYNLEQVPVDVSFTIIHDKDRCGIDANIIFKDDEIELKWLNK